MTIETANRLYELRKKQGLSQEELAEKLGVSRQAVSKWERSESSPDTDNLIALAQLYGMSLDELIYGEKASKEEPKADAAYSDNEEPGENEATDYEYDGEKIKVDSDGIFIESKDGDKVKIDLSGILVKSNDGDKVRIGLKGIKIETDDDDDNDDDDEWESIEIKIKCKSSFWYKFPYPILCLIAYLTFGCLNICGGWALSWIVFTTIPLYYSFITAIYKRRFCAFAYPVFTATAYLFVGLYFGGWHPWWIIFLTIPLYYYIAGLIDNKTHSKSKK